jgi:uncharacterized zinc-type alcohol dehydrogenase-like protein
MQKISAYGLIKENSNIVAMTIPRRDVGLLDVKIDILYCGICHSDVHRATNDWKDANYPLVPGHEIIGRVSIVGLEVKKFKVGDIVGVGCMVDSCRSCQFCNSKLEQYCECGPTYAYNSVDKVSGGYTYGGYSEYIVVNEDFVLKIPQNLSLDAAAPLLCAGVTMYSPLIHWKVKSGDKVGIVGLGGLGHMGVKFANALGANVVVITTSTTKIDDAKKLGAKEVLISSDLEQVKKYKNSFDFIINTIPVSHDINPYMELLKYDKTMVLVGSLTPLPAIDGKVLIRGRKNLAGSLIGGIKETQDMLDFCAKNQITCDIEKINIDQVNKAYERMIKNDVKYRFVIDMSSLEKF